MKRGVCGALALVVFATMAEAQAPERQRIGVALGGGSARGLAHVGVLRWFDEHRVPIDVLAGTSMGGLVGGAFAAGWEPVELQSLLDDTDWDTMFGASSFEFRNIRRKLDGRAYPSRIEFGLKGGIVPPDAINNGQQVELLLARIAASYGTLDSFDRLPTPFRAVAVDLVTSRPVVLERGSLARAMRATMSLPGVFPPVELDGHVLVDGGAMDNVPADVVRGMGADVVIAVNVGSLEDRKELPFTIFGLMGATVDSMMIASTRRAIESADVVIAPAVVEFGSLDWRRSPELAEEGYKAAEALRDKLLPLALGESEWAAYIEARRARRQARLPVPTFVDVVGAAEADAATIRQRLEPFLGTPIDAAELAEVLTAFSGLDRYDTVGWELATRDGQAGLVIRARDKRYAPPFFMLGIALENTTTGEFSFNLSGRYLAFDVVGSGSELRIDASAGSNPSAGFELYKAIGRSRIFGTASAFVGRERLNFIADDAIVAQYDETRVGVGLDLGVNLSRESEVRLGVTLGHLDTSVHTGDPALPELSGAERTARLRWILDTQDSPIVPSRGTLAEGQIRYFFESPELPPEFALVGSNRDLVQAEIDASRFWSIRGGRDRVFGLIGAGTSFDGHPLPTQQFSLGRPLRLSAYNLGEVRGDHYLLATVGYLRGIARLPDFIGGPLMVGGWLENGTAFNDWDAADLRTQIGVGLVADTLFGPVILGTSVAADDGAWRYYVGIGKVFR